MSDKTGIEWTDATWNPVVGCAHVSPGCDHCYAAREAAGRLSGLLPDQYAGLAVRPADGGPARFTGEVRLLADRLDHPIRLKRPRRIFVNSMSDLFHKDVPDEFIARVFAVMACAPQHQFQVLTKRPQRMEALLGADYSFQEGMSFTMLVHDAIEALGHREACYDTWPLPNVWLGVSIENDRYAWRADYLRNTPAAVRWISAEPLLGPLPSLDLTGIDWLVAGGESGPGARPMHPDWVRDLRDRCTDLTCPECDGRVTAGDPDSVLCCWCSGKPFGTAFLFKQAGAVLGKEWGCRHRAGGDIDEWPDEFKIREYPCTTN